MEVTSNTSPRRPWLSWGHRAGEGLEVVPGSPIMVSLAMNHFTWDNGCGYFRTKRRGRTGMRVRRQSGHWCRDHAPKCPLAEMPGMSSQVLGCTDRAPVRETKCPPTLNFQPESPAFQTLYRECLQSQEYPSDMRCKFTSTTTQRRVQVAGKVSTGPFDRLWKKTRTGPTSRLWMQSREMAQSGWLITCNSSAWRALDELIQWFNIAAVAYLEYRPYMEH